MRKYYLIATTKYLCFQYSVTYCRHLSRSDVVLWEPIRPFDVLAIGDGVGCCEQSGAYRLVLHWSRYKGERPVLSICLASSTASASHSRPVWWLLYFSTGQRFCPQGAWDRAAVNLWNTRLHRSSSVASQQSWPEPGRLPDVGLRITAGCMTMTSWSHTWSKSWNISTTCSLMKRSGSHIHVFELAFEHTEDILNTDFSYIWYL